MKFNRILLCSGICAMLISTGCSAAPYNSRHRASLNDGSRAVTRSVESGRASNGVSHNRFARPVNRGYNVRHRTNTVNARLNTAADMHRTTDGNSYNANNNNNGFRVGNLGRNHARRSQDRVRRNLTITDDLNAPPMAHRRSSGHVTNFNRGNGVVRDYRFDHMNRTHGLIDRGGERFLRNTPNNALFVRDYENNSYVDNIADWHDNLRDDFVRTDNRAIYFRGRKVAGENAYQRGPSVGNYTSSYTGTGSKGVTGLL